MLFLESPLKLPTFNIDLPLLAFYILTPIIFVVLHFYMLLNLVLLARTARTFEDALGLAFPEDGPTRENFRMRIENTLFAQLLVGASLEREGRNATFLSLMALITLALAPAALLLIIQIKFLPYHSEPITWLHRGLLALDLALVWTLWPGYRSGWGVRLWPKASRWLVWPAVGSAAALAYAVMVATFPDERIYVATYRLHGSTYWDPDTSTVSSPDMPNWYAFIAPINILDLRGEDLIDDKKLDDIKKKNESRAPAQKPVATLSLAAGRDLTGANLLGADVRYVDFSEAILNRAILDSASADEATLVGAQLQGASLHMAKLQGADLLLAQLQGASLAFAQLQGASLVGAQLQGASLHRADLQGALLVRAQLQGAWLNFAGLEGASLDYAQLQGASLYFAQLQGALLDSAGLQGASLDAVQLTATSFRNVFVWRADARSRSEVMPLDVRRLWKVMFWKDTRVASPEIGPKRLCYDSDRPPKEEDKDKVCTWTADTFEERKRLITNQVPESENRRHAMERVEQRLDPTKPLEGEEEMAKVWTDLERSSPDTKAYEQNLAEQWRKTGCAAEGAPYVLRALLIQLDILGSRSNVAFALLNELGFKRNFSISPFAENSPEVPKLAAAFLDKNCAGARGL